MVISYRTRSEFIIQYSTLSSCSGCLNIVSCTLFSVTLDYPTNCNKERRPVTQTHISSLPFFFILCSEQGSRQSVHAPQTAIPWYSSSFHCFFFYNFILIYDNRSSPANQINMALLILHLKAGDGRSCSSVCLCPVPAQSVGEHELLESRLRNLLLYKTDSCAQDFSLLSSYTYCS